MSKSLALLCSILALSFVGLGCGDNDAGMGGNAGDESPEAPQKSGDKKGGGTEGGGAGTDSNTVSMKEIEFKPKEISVTKGTKVTWTNDESAPHDVTKTGGPGPKFSSGSGNMQKGDTYSQTFNTAGTIKYVCTVHPGMDGTVTVK